MNTVQLTAVGESVGIVLPKELLERLSISKGDILHLEETSNGVVLTPCDAEFTNQMEVAERIMQQDHDVLRKLAE